MKGGIRGLVLGPVLMVLSAPLLAGAEPPWAEPFAANPSAVLASAAAEPGAEPGAVALILFEDCEFHFEEDGRRTQTYRLVYRVDADEAGGWDSVSVSWAPWHQEKPTLRARVLTRDGAVHVLDPATIAESGVGQEDKVYSDRRQLDAPLPAVSRGAVVEEQWVLRETAPFFEAGTTGHFYFGTSVPVRRVRLVIDAPRGLPVHVAPHLSPVPEAQRIETGARVRTTYEQRDLAALPTRESNLPPDQPVWPGIRFATGRSWADVAQAYAAVVDRQLEGASLTVLAREARGQAKERREIVERLLARVHRDVRYTGVEFGEASIVPRTPGEVLARRYGDCKDKASLLVGLLRSAGIPAAVALLSSGFGEDVPRDLPGLGVFNHAIVYVPGTPPFWIDATADRARVGDLPVNDQGRLALVADPQTTGLVTTPEAVATENGSVETRDFYLSELGAARVVETTDYFGAFDRSFRDDYSEADSEKTKDRMFDYVRDEYLADALATFEKGEVGDLSRPFRLKVEATGAKRGSTDDKEAVVALFPQNLLNGLPKSILGGDTEAERAKERKRERPYFFATPQFVEYRYRVVPPPGYLPGALPATEVITLGPARINVRWEPDPQGPVTGSLRFETGPRRISAEDFEALKAAVRAFRKRPTQFVRFRQVGEEHLANGRVPDALSEFRKLAAAHPKEALHHTQVAMALLTAGLGESAREAARRAVAVEPGSPVAHRRLGWMLQHDLVGRRFRKGADLAAAEVAYRKAVELDPANTNTRMNLAYLLEHGLDGQRYGDKQRLSLAADEYWRLARDYGEPANNLVHALLRSGRYDEIPEAALKFAEGEARDSFEILGAALKEGVPAALKRAAQIRDPEARRSALAENADWLVTVRRYGDAAALLREAAQGSSKAAQHAARSELLSRVRPHEERAHPEKGPAGVALAFIREILVGTDVETLVSFFNRTERDRFQKDKEREGAEIRRLLEALPRRVGDVPRAVVADIALAVMGTAVEGDDQEGYRVRVTDATGSAPSMVLYLIREDDGHRIIASSHDVWDLGNEVLLRIDAGRLDGARRVLDWAREEVRSDGDDPAGGHPLARLWTVGQPATAEQVRLAAAGLLVTSPNGARRGVEILEAQPPAGREQEGSALALLWGYETLGREEDVLSLAGHMAEKSPASSRLFGTRARALEKLHRWADLKAFAEQRRRERPGDLEGLRQLRRALVGLGDLSGVVAICGSLLESGRSDANDYNECAWNALFVGGEPVAALERAQKAVSLSSRKQAAYLHTLATLQAFENRPAEARQVLLESMEVKGKDAPDSTDWLVFGRIAESYGVGEAALAAYGRVAKESDSPLSSFVLARKRLALLPPATRHPARP